MKNMFHWEDIHHDKRDGYDVWIFNSQQKYPIHFFHSQSRTDVDDNKKKHMRVENSEEME